MAVLPTVAPIAAPMVAQVAAVAAGAVAGSLLRWACGLWLNDRLAAFPLGTLAVNCVGGLLVGIALAGFERAPNELLRLLVVTGFLGGFTTFSAFSVESLVMIQRGEWAAALAHAAAHVLGALLLAAAGYRLARLLLPGGPAG